ncbi:hypothetical protein MJO29_000228 [Puccinia striiformis f. sp. tritici]|uniref:Protein RER1 n=3 Tax=Puccinia striiformis TaxID=27350 RepID=A0A0L0UVU3_9BASI|nr:hypothetical protein Pst134EA_033218 [Puccinia striiformis f. sp. tritici]KAH9473149.1 hypothetical protein Pst134EA_033218 [Puccinia striiformis f. sp. tritici]KAI7966951.1 hypothetical protein MJO29_000228 [Puccinia striiformis f. sp. tritici]KNE91167.1 hypothetical protein PSTG_15423 [Puccinia striiformis f. sp. tritici PST-78]
MMNADSNLMQDEEDSNETAFTRKYRELEKAYQYQLDRLTPYTTYRWLSTSGLILIFMLRILLSQGWYIVTYALGIYLLNLFLSFLQPKFDPSIEQDAAENEVEEGGPGSSTSNLLGGQNMDGDEFKPFIRRLPEFKFWHSATRATIFSLIATCFEFTDVPVFWPILLVYFLVLFSITMRRQIAHMRRYKYVPWDYMRKARYTGSK